MSLKQLHDIAYIFSTLGCDTGLRDQIAELLSKNERIPLILTLEDLFYVSEIRKMFGLGQTVSEDFIRKCQNPDGGFGDRPNSTSTACSTYFAVKLLNSNGWMRNDIATKAVGYVLGNEWPQGGFCNPRETSIHSLYSCVLALNDLNSKPTEIGKLKVWLKYCQNDDGGFGNSPNSESLEKTTYWSVDALNRLNSLDIINKESLVGYLNRNITDVNPFRAYYLAGTYEILETVPPDFENIAKELMTYNSSGGFAPGKQDSPEMYETFRAVNAIKSLTNILKKKGKSFGWLSGIRDETARWVLSCENPEGGFSWVPHEIPYIQPTYHALSVLDVFGVDVKDAKKHIEWISSFQNSDGGFNGGEKGTPSDTHFTFWALECLRLLHAIQ